MSVKYPEHILAFPASNILAMGIRQGLDCDHQYPKFLREAKPIWEQRSALEDDFNHQQCLPYRTYVAIGLDDEEDMIMVYQRAKTVGEEKLLNNFSVGFGGHIDKDPDYTIRADESFDLHGTIEANRVRENMEETNVLVKVNDQGELRMLKPEAVTDYHLGFINDHSDDVGKKHLGISTIVTVPKGSEVHSNEPNQIIRGWMTLAEIEQHAKALEGTGVKYENWSNLVLARLRELFTTDGRKFNALVVRPFPKRPATNDENGASFLANNPFQTLSLAANPTNL